MMNDPNAADGAVSQEKPPPPEKNHPVLRFLGRVAAWLADVTKTFHLLRAQIIIVLIAMFLLSYEQTIDEYRALYANVFEPVHPDKQWLSIVTLVSSAASLFLLFPFTIWFTSRWLTNRNDDGSLPRPDTKQFYRRRNDTRSWTRKWLPRALAVAPLLSVAYAAWKAGQTSEDTTLRIASLFCALVSAAWVFLLFVRTPLKLFSAVSTYLDKEFNDLKFIFLIFLIANVLIVLVAGVAIPQALGILTYGIGFFIVVLVFTTFLAWGHMRTKVPYMILLGLWTAFLAYLDWTNNHKLELLTIEASEEPLEFQTAFEAWLDHKIGETESATADEKIPVFIVAAAGGGIFAAQNAAFFLAKLDDSLASEGCGQFSRHVFAISGVSGGSVGAALHGALLKHQLAMARGGKNCADEDALLEPKLFNILNEDLLAPVVANFVALDYPQRFLPSWLVSFPDRATALEDAILSSVSSHAPDARPYLEEAASLHWNADSGLPALVLNTAELNSGRTVASSPFKLHGRDFHKNGPAAGFPTKDATFREILAPRPPDRPIYEPLENCASPLVDVSDTERFDKNRDLSLIQAAVLSARFPYASPAGTITRLTSSSECSKSGPDGPPEPALFAAETQYVDGGYVESSGTEQALRLFKLLQSQVEAGCLTDGRESKWCRVDIHLVAINLRTDSLISDTSFGLVLTPPMGLVKTWSQRSQTSREALIDYFELSRFRPGVKGLHMIQPYDANNAIPLGWRLSEQTSRKLRGFLCAGLTKEKMVTLLELVSPARPVTLACDDD